MKTKNLIQTIKLFIIGLAIAFSQTSYALNSIDPVKSDSTDSQSSVVSVIVTLDPDCPALQNCAWEVLLFDVNYCTQDTQPIDIRDYKYGDDVNFSSKTFNNSMVKVCVRHKPGTPDCGYTNYAPRCVCRTITSSPMYIPVDICNP